MAQRRTLKEWRGDMTQQQLAVRVGVSVSTIANIESGRHQPRWALALRIAEVIGAPLDRITWSDRTPKKEAA